jgi:hypothetical protein
MFPGNLRHPQLHFRPVEIVVRDCCKRFVHAQCLTSDGIWVQSENRTQNQSPIVMLKRKPQLALYRFATETTVAA